MSKGFLDIKIGDKVVCFDKYSHDYDEHILVIDSIEDDKEYSTETNPLGRRFFGTDQDYVDENGDFEDGDYNYLTVVDETNFVYVIDED